MPSPGSPELRLGPFSGHWYGLLVGLGAVVFCITSALVARRRGEDPWDVLWLCLAALPCALIGGRLYHLVTGGSGAPGEGAFDVGGGGLGIFGAALGGGIALVVGARIRRLDPVRVARLRDARAGPRTGDRPARELVQPGAVRRADGPAVGARDRCRAPSTGPADASPGSSRRSRSRRSGTSDWRRSSSGCCSDDARQGAGSRSGCGSPGTVRDGSGSRGCGSSPRTTSARCA